MITRTLVAALATLAATPAPTTEPAWTREHEAGFAGCRHAAFDLRLRPAQTIGDTTLPDFAIGALLSPQGDEGLEFQLRRTERGTEMSSADVVWPEDDGPMPGAAFIRVSIDGRRIRSGFEEAYEVFEWYPANSAAWHRALLAGRVLTIEYLDERRKPLGTRDIDLTPIPRMIAAIENAQWRC